MSEIVYLGDPENDLMAAQMFREERRLAELRRYNILDSQPEQSFDRLAELASQWFNTPQAFITLVDQKRQWFKSCIGMDNPGEVDRGISFCSHAIEQDVPLIIPDARLDPRFYNNPLVTGGMYIRFYAGAPLINSNGERLGTLCITNQQPREISEQDVKVLTSLAAIVVNEMELRLARLTAEKDSADKSQYVAYIGHEVRTPLMTIQTAMSLLDKDKLTKQDKYYVQLMGQANEILLETINDFLDATKLETKAITLENIAFKPEAIIEQVATLVRLRVSENVKIHMSVEQPVDITLLGDPTRLRQIVMNFVCNAGKFTEYGDIFIRSKVVPLGDGRNKLRIEVEDSGIGMTQEQITKLFGKFIQADSSVCRIYGGSGLGLYICKQISDLMEGQVGAESAPGKGSIFWFEAPFGEVKEQLPATADTELAEQIACHILLVEDNRVNHELLKAVMEQHGYQVTSAYNGRQAVERAAEQTFDMIFMDCQMPIMDGFEATKYIRAHPQPPNYTTPIIAVTANAMAGDKQRCFDAGMDDYLAKPVKAAAMQQIVRQWLKRGVALRKEII